MRTGYDVRVSAHLWGIGGEGFRASMGVRMFKYTSKYRVSGSKTYLPHPE